MEVLSQLRRTARRARETRSRVVLLGCLRCGQILKGESESKVGSLSGDSCPECGYAIRVVDLAAAQQLTRERYMAAHWREIAVAKEFSLERDGMGEAPAGASLG